MNKRLKRIYIRALKYERRLEQTRAYSAQDNAMVIQIHMKREVVIDHTSKEAFTMPRRTLISLKECHIRMPQVLQKLYRHLLKNKYIVKKAILEGNLVRVELQNSLFDPPLLMPGPTFVLRPGHMYEAFPSGWVTLPQFHMVKSPVINISDIKTRRFNVIDQHQKASK